MSEAGGSKFAGLFPSRQEEPPTDVQNAESPEYRTAENSKRRVSESPTGRRMGRPPGKKSDPDYRQVTVYLPVDLHDEGRERAFRSRGGTDFSGLVEAALREYFARGKD